MTGFRYAARSLSREPGFCAVAIITLALGIGGNTAVFSLVYQTLLRPLPFSDADRLVFIWNSYPLMGLAQASVSIPDYLDRTSGAAPAIEDGTLFTRRALNFAAENRPEQVRALAVTPSFFSTLGRSPALGRTFTPADAMPGADRYAILTHAFWMSRFGGDRSILGRDIRLSGELYQVVGVLPADFEVPSAEISLLVPFAFAPDQTADTARGNEFSSMIARLRPGTTIEQLNAQMSAIVSRNAERLPARFGAFVRTSGFRGVTVPIRDQLVGDARPALYLLQAGVAVVLLIACVNVGSLLLMRATTRYRDLAIRMALGAGRWQMLRQMLAEGLLLSAAGTLLGLALAWVAITGLIALEWRQTTVAVTSSIDSVVLLATAATTTAAGLLCGWVAWVGLVGGNMSAVLKEDGPRTSGGGRTARVRALLVVAETALALVLLVGAVLLMKSVGRLQQVDPGFSPDHVLTLQLALPAPRYPDAPARFAFWSRLLDRVRALPGVTAAGFTSNVPFNGSVSSGSYSIVGYTPPETEAQPHGRQEVVGGDYFRAMQIPLLQGRMFTDTDSADAPPVVVVDQLLVRRYFQDRSPIGQQIRRGGPTSPPFTIVGVVGTINSIDLGEPVTKERLYYPLAQQARPGMALVVKTAGDPGGVVAAIRSAVGAIDPEQPVADVRTLDDWIARSLGDRRSPMLVLVAFALVALALAAIGVHGVAAYGVAQRRREFGIRQALGADRRSIRMLVLRQALKYALAGAAVGLAVAWAAAGVLRSVLFGVGPRDPLVYAAVAALLLAVTAVACDRPARRAMRVDPAAALRES